MNNEEEIKQRISNVESENDRSNWDVKPKPPLADFVNYDDYYTKRLESLTVCLLNYVKQIEDVTMEEYARRNMSDELVEKFIPPKQELTKHLEEHAAVLQVLVDKYG